MRTTFVYLTTDGQIKRVMFYSVGRQLGDDILSVIKRHDYRRLLDLYHSGLGHHHNHGIW